MSSPRPFLYVKPGCPWCEEAEEYLHEHGIAYGKADVLSDATASSEAGGPRTVPGRAVQPRELWPNPPQIEHLRCVCILS